MKILHVTEAMGGGLVTFLRSIAGAQTALGHSVTVAYLRRVDSPETPALVELFADRAELRAVSVEGEGILRLARLARFVWTETPSYDVVHLHSSYAGAIGRIFSRSSRLYYSPHGYGFLREDVGRFSRCLYRMAERILGKRGETIATSRSEQTLAKHMGVSTVHLLRTGVPSEAIAKRPPLTGAQLGYRRPRVTMVGRMVFQKAPWRFAEVAHALGESAEFVWVGGGNPRDREKWIGMAPVRVLPWVSPEELAEVLLETDVFLFPTLWEGMSLSLVQAQAAGIPCVTSDVVGNRDAVVDGETGFVCSTEEEMIRATRALLQDSTLRATLAANAVRHAAANLTDDHIGRDSEAIYDGRR